MALKTKKFFLHSSLALGSLLILAILVFLNYQTKKAHAEDFLKTDVNQDGIVDQKDADLVALNFADSANNSPYDLTNDGIIDAKDLAIVENDQGNGTNPDRDWDKDGYSVAENDCNDRDKNVHPLLHETANGIDDNCNGRIDELVDHEPISSTEMYDVNFSFLKGDTSDVELKVDGVTVSTKPAPTIGHRGFGSYTLMGMDSAGKTIDSIYFDVPTKAIVESFSGGNIASKEQNIPSGTFTISFPKTAQVTRLQLRKIGNKSLVIDVPISSAKMETPKTSNEVDDTCPSSLQGEGPEKKYGVLRCLNFDGNDDIVNALVQVYQTMRSSMPEAIYIPISMVSIDANANCGTSGASWAGCYKPGLDYLYLNEDLLLDPPIDAVKDLYGVKTTIAHELGHHLMFSAQAAYVVSNEEIADQEFDYFAELVSFLSRRNCNDGKYCSVDFEDFNSEWHARVLTPCNYLLCNDFGPTLNWNSNFLTNPLTGYNPSHASPRPGDPGTVTPYAVFSTIEEFAETIASLFEDYASPSDNAGYKRIVQDFTKHDPPLSIVGLTTRTALLGKYGLIKDWDHDGVPDTYDNCAPQNYAFCKDDATRCANSDQTDINPKNNKGDLCEHFGEFEYTCPDGHTVWYKTEDLPKPVTDYQTVYTTNGRCELGTHVTNAIDVALCGEKPHGNKAFLTGICVFVSDGGSPMGPSKEMIDGGLPGCSSNADCAHFPSGAYAGGTCELNAACGWSTF